MLSQHFEASLAGLLRAFHRHHELRARHASTADLADSAHALYVAGMRAHHAAR